jgi:glycine cleavage system H protein
MHCPTYQKLAWGDLPSGQPRRLTNVAGVFVEDGVYYATSHTWVQQVNGTVRIGVDDFAQRLVGVIDEVVLPTQGKVLKAGRLLARLRCGTRTIKLYSPVAGTVVGANEQLAGDTSVVNNDPYGRGWLVELRPGLKNPSRLYRTLYGGREAAQWMEQEVGQLQHLVQGEVGVTMSDGGVLIGNLRNALAPHEWERLIATFLERRA